MNGLELIEFNRAHNEAVEFVTAATDDYVACRCCLLNGLFSGLRLGSEAVEKYLKAFLLYGNPSLTAKYLKRKYNHQIQALAKAASALNLEPRFDSSRFDNIIGRLETHYERRYPDVENFEHDASTGELAGIDELVLYTYDSLPIPEAPKLRNFGYFFFVCCSWIPSNGPYKAWLEKDNKALQPVKASLVQRFQAVEEQLK